MAEKEPTPKPTDEEETTRKYSQSEVDELLNKVRSEANRQQHAEKERERQRAEKAEREAEEARKKAEETKALLEKQKEEALTAEQLLAKREAEMAEKAEEFKQQMNSVAEEAALRIHLADLNSYRAKRIAETGLVLTDLVVGDSKEEVDAAVEAAKAKEDAIRKQAAEEAEKKLRQESANNVPSPASAPDSEKPVSTRFSMKDRRQIAKMPPDEFNKLKNDLLEKALEKK